MGLSIARTQGRRGGLGADAGLLHRAATKEEIAKSGVTVASLFFRKVFGAKAQKALTVFVALR